MGLTLLFLVAIASSPHVTVVAVGDVMMARGIASVCAERGWDYPFEDVRELLRGDIVFGNLEHPVSSRGVPKEGGILLRANPECLPALRRAGFTVMSLANNHTMDYGPTALLDTLEYLHKNDIIPVGAGRTIEEAIEGVVVELDRARVGFLAFSVFPEENNGGPAIAVMSDDAIVRSIKRLREDCDYVVVSAHWGFERTVRVSPMQRRLGRMAVDSGANLVLGHHPHVPQEIERYKGGVIAYSLGNFVFDRSPRGDRGILLRCSLTKVGVSFEAVPVVIRGGRPTPEVR